MKVTNLGVAHVITFADADAAGAGRRSEVVEVVEVIGVVGFNAGASSCSTHPPRSSTPRFMPLTNQFKVNPCLYPRNR